MRWQQGTSLSCRSPVRKQPDDPSNPDWRAYQWFRSRGESPRVLRLYRGDSLQYWADDGIEILSPTPRLVQLANSEEDWNDVSYVLRVRYAGHSVILGGDAGHRVWEDLLAAYGSNLRCDVLKASHHGRESGCYVDALKKLCPQFTIVSVGKKPEQDASNVYRYYSGEVWSTRWKGDITLNIYEDSRGELIPEYQR